ncbi:MAG: 30S ribosomal protein S12 methylthiotransferase RimO [Bacteroidetes bacterium]|nr:30S ribosomal protein S12 methylthiotransferase RimO [Bacteroidota bacterium]
MKTKQGQTDRIKIITLGCPKNKVDSEILMRQLQAGRIPVLNEFSEETGDIILINTCGFIHDAKEESIDIILQYLKAKEKGYVRKVIVMGCLAQRYQSELQKELPEIDGLFGVNQLENILASLGADYKKELIGERVLTTPSHYAYLKVSEGCDRQCSFCAIPSIRGRHASKPLDDILREAEWLASSGVKELILIAQDLTYYGLDLFKKRTLPELVDKLSQIAGIQWIRLHYTYPAGFPVELLDVMKKHDQICKYIDMPVQHISNRILTSMKRTISARETWNLLTLIRKTLPDAAIRTTLILGYPGETEKEFNELSSFIKDFRFDRLGVFTYSHEENTPAFKLIDDIPLEVKKKRADEIMQIQEVISLELNNNKIGKTFKIVIDRKEGDYFIGRTEYDSPEIDNEVLIKADSFKLTTGQFYPVRITDADSFDLFGEVR